MTLSISSGKISNHPEICQITQFPNFQIFLFLRISVQNFKSQLCWWQMETTLQTISRRCWSFSLGCWLLVVLPLESDPFGDKVKRCKHFCNKTNQCWGTQNVCTLTPVWFPNTSKAPLPWDLGHIFGIFSGYFEDIFGILSGYFRDIMHTYSSVIP